MNRNYILKGDVFIMKSVERQLYQNLVELIYTDSEPYGSCFAIEKVVTCAKQGELDSLSDEEFEGIITSLEQLQNEYTEKYYDVIEKAKELRSMLDEIFEFYSIQRQLKYYDDIVTSTLKKSEELEDSDESEDTLC